jgi:hypothetical protein
MRFARVSCIVALLWTAHTGLLAQEPAAPAPAPDPARGLTLAEREEFLKKAKIIRRRGVNKGVTGTVRATLTDGIITHDASIQTINEYRQRFESNRGTEFNFTDSWRYNVAAYRLDRLLDLGMIPPSVERYFEGKKASYTWWVDDVLMDEGARLKGKIDAPDPQRWNEQMWHVRLFDQLIYNTDRNLGNLLIDEDWAVWMIDHSRAFRLLSEPKSPANISKVDRRVFERLKALDRATLDAALKNYLTPGEMKALLQRRDAIVAYIEGRNAIFDWSRPPRPAP